MTREIKPLRQTLPEEAFLTWEKKSRRDPLLKKETKSRAIIIIMLKSLPCEGNMRERRKKVKIKSCKKKPNTAYKRLSHSDDEMDLLARCHYLHYY